MEGKLSKGKGYRIAMVGGEELALGFKLAGVHESIIAETAAEAEDKIRQLLQKDDIGIIVISSRLANGIKDRKLLNAIDTSLLPIFIEVPEYGDSHSPDTLRRLILRAIGIDISKKIGS